MQTVAVPLDIQWTDTDACLHLQCLCGVEVHSDTPYIERITCDVCGRTYILPPVVFAEVRGDGGSSDVPVS